ncbi:hypothetical protein GS434_20230 [Rhodococcus hoagii]|nr:hypothetical protein [Prescottella equi]
MRATSARAGAGATERIGRAEGFAERVDSEFGGVEIGVLARNLDDGPTNIAERAESVLEPEVQV